MSDLLPHLQFGAEKDESEMTVILMHGLGADGHDFADVAQMLADAAKPAKWRFVLPHAPHMPVTINMGMTMPAWYDILDMNHPREVNWDSVQKSREAIEAIIEAEGNASTVVAGFSQGGAMALHVGLRNQDKIKGILSMSGYLLVSDENPCPEKKADFPIAIFHGAEDPVVPLRAAEESVSVLQENQYEISAKNYPGLPHSVSEEEIRDVFQFLQGIAGH